MAESHSPTQGPSVIRGAVSRLELVPGCLGDRANNVAKPNPAVQASREPPCFRVWMCWPQAGGGTPTRVPVRQGP